MSHLTCLFQPFFIAPIGLYFIALCLAFIKVRENILRHLGQFIFLAAHRQCRLPAGLSGETLRSLESCKFYDNALDLSNDYQSTFIQCPYIAKKTLSKKL